MKKDQDWEFEELDREFETTRMPVDEIEKRLARENRKSRQSGEAERTEEAEKTIRYEKIHEPIGDETRVLDAALRLELERRMTGFEDDAEDVVDEMIVEDEDFDYYEADEDSGFGEEEDGDEEYYQRPPRRNNGHRKKENFFQNMVYSLAHMTVMDRVVVATGMLVLIFAIVTGTVYISTKNTQAAVASFSTVGEQLAGVEVIGESGLLAVTEATLARLNSFEEPEEEESIVEEPTDEQIQVGMKLSSIQKDLKIKFVNKSTDKLIASVPFAVDIKSPDGKTTSKTDDDKDGIIYLSGIASGKYTVTMKTLEGYDRYSISTASESVTVKDTIEYKKVDVSDEVKTEAEVNVAIEDTKKEETVVESQLTDTVEWVESTKKESNSSYTEVKKSDIPDPSTLAKAMSPTNVFKASRTLLLTNEGTGDIPAQTVTGNENPQEPEKTKKLSLSAASAAVKVGESTTLTIQQENISDLSISLSNSSVASVKRDGDKLTVTGQAVGETTLEVKGDGLTATCKITVTKDAVKVSLDQTSLTLAKGKKATLKATVEHASNTGITWATSDGSIATVSDSGEVTGVKAGKVTITATSKEDGNAKATCEVTVKEGLVVALDQTAASVVRGKTLTLKATVSNFNSDSGVTWSSSDKNIATVTDAGIVTGVKAGKATITVTCKEDSNVKATCEVTVTEGLMITLDPKTMTLYKGKTGEIKVKVEGFTSNSNVTFETSDKNIATVSDKGVVTGVNKGKVNITVISQENKDVKAVCEVTVKAGAEDDTTSKLKDKNGNQLYYKDSNGNYVEAAYADYYKYDVFYLKNPSYIYTGWQTIDNTLYFFDKNGNKVVGDQVIQGAKYSFADSGALITGSGVLGIDVSKHNGTIDWAAVKNSGVSYVIIRCGYRGSTTGALIEDPKFKSNIKGAQAAGLKVGIYFFTQAINEAEAVEEASMVLQLIKPYAISYPVYLDVESSGGRADGISKDTRTAVCKAFCATIANSGYTSGIYANKTWLNEKLSPSALGGHKIWLAQYAAAPTYNGPYHMWQYSSKGSVSGISGRVDMNLSYLGY